MINVALASPHSDETEVNYATQVVVDDTSKGMYGIRSWSAQDLYTKQGVTPPSTTRTDWVETKRFAQYYVDNYAEPLNRVTSITFRSMNLNTTGAAANWLLLSRDRHQRPGRDHARFTRRRRLHGRAVLRRGRSRDLSPRGAGDGRHHPLARPVAGRLLRGFTLRNMSTIERKPLLHGRDHCPGGADPIPCMISGPSGDFSRRSARDRPLRLLAAGRDR